MDIVFEKENGGSDLLVKLEGRLDTLTAPELEDGLRDNLDGVEELTLDLGGLEYISSAGLRVLLSAQKIMNRQGRMILKKIRGPVREVLRMTGFLDILTIDDTDEDAAEEGCPEEEDEACAKTEQCEQDGQE